MKKRMEPKVILRVSILPNAWACPRNLIAEMYAQRATEKGLFIAEAATVRKSCDLKVSIMRLY